MDQVVTVHAVAVVDGVTATSGPSAAEVVNAFGPPGVPAVGGQVEGDQAVLGWDAQAAGNGREPDSVEVQTAIRGRFSTNEVVGSVTEGAPGDEVWIRARVLDILGRYGSWSDFFRLTIPTGKGDVTLAEVNSPTPTDAECSGLTAPCNYVTLALRGWTPNASVTCTVAALDWRMTRTLDADGNAPPSYQGDTGNLVKGVDSPIVMGTNTGSAVCQLT